MSVNNSIYKKYWYWHKIYCIKRHSRLAQGVLYSWEPIDTVNFDNWHIWVLVPKKIEVM